MVRMPNWTDIPDAPQIQSPGVVGAAQDFVPGALAGLGKTISDGADNLAEMQMRIARKAHAQNDTLELTKANADWNVRRTTELSQYDLTKNPDTAKWMPTYDENIQKHLDASASMISNPRLKEQFLANAKADITIGSLKLGNDIQNIDLDKKKADAFAGIDSNLNIASAPSTSHADIERVTSQSLASIQNLVKIGAITSVQGQQASQAYAQKFAGANIGRDIQSDPGQASKWLEGGSTETYLNKTRTSESSGNDLAKTDVLGQTASGRYGFTVGTWKTTLKSHPELGLTMADKSNGEKQDLAMRALTEDNKKVLENSGVPSSEANLRLAHVNGAQGAIDLLHADPNAEAAKMFPQSAAANHSTFYTKDNTPRSVAEVIAVQTKGYSHTDSPTPAYYQFVDPAERRKLLMGAGMGFDTMQAQTAKQATNDLASITQSGKSLIDDKDMDSFKENYLKTHDQAALEKYQTDRAVATDVYTYTKDLGTMTQDRMVEVLKSLKPTGGPTADVQQKVYDTVEARMKEAVTLQKSQRVVDEAQQKAVSDQSANNYMMRILKGDPKDLQTIGHDIATDPTLTWQTRKELAGVAANPPGQTSGTAYSTTLNRIVSDASDPNHIQDASQILKLVASNELTHEEGTKLITDLGNMKKDANGAGVVSTKAGMLTYAKEIMSFDQEMTSPYMPPLKDPKGQKDFNSRFLPAFESAFDKWTQAGKDPYEFLTKDNVDKIMKPFMRSPSEMAADRISSGAFDPTAKDGDSAKKPIESPPAPQGVNPKGWDDLMQGRPVTPEGNAVDPLKWAATVDYLRKNPTLKNIAIFDNAYGQSGFSAADVLDRVKPRAMPSDSVMGSGFASGMH